MLASAYLTVGEQMAAVIIGCLAAWSGFIGLAFGKRKATKYITGSKF